MDSLNRSLESGVGSLGLDSDYVRVINAVLDEVLQERAKQDDKFGQQNHNTVAWMAILTEEVGESAKEACEVYFKQRLRFKNKEVGELYSAGLKNLREELIQVAAVAVAFVESLDRNELSTNGRKIEVRNG